MRALLLTGLLLAGPAPKAPAPARAPDAPRAVPDVTGALKAPKARPAGGHGQTNCKACHGTGTWTDVRFNHERTGFSLSGQHARVTCKGCHVADFSTPLPRGCPGCHLDVHAGELGLRCEGCHDTTDWRSRFDVDAHRRTNFPLVGAHAAVPCVECHAEARERRFTRATVDCTACHQGQLARTVGTAVDHVGLQFDQRSCRECHTGLSFTPARYPSHDQDCFYISSGPHAVACNECHSSLQSAPPGRGLCLTNTAQCTRCHTNDQAPGSRTADTDRQHANAAGYQWVDRKCFECHRSGDPL